MEKNQYLKQIQSAKSQKNYDLMLASAKEAMAAFPNDKELEELLHDAQGYYVNEKLHSELLKTLEEKQDWQGLQAVYLKLLSVFPESRKLHRLLEKVKMKIQKTAEKAKEDFYLKATEKIEEMIRQKKYNDAENACYEILSTDSTQKTIIRLLAKVQHKIDQEIEASLSLYYKSSVPALKKEYKAHHEDFIRV